MPLLPILYYSTCDSQKGELFNLLSEQYFLSEVQSLEEAIKQLGQNMYYFAILNLEGHERDYSLEIGEYIQKAYKELPIIYISISHSEIDFKRAMSTNPYFYFCVNHSRINEVLYNLQLFSFSIGQKVEGNQKPSNYENDLLIRKGNHIHKVSKSMVNYIEVEENYSTLHTSDAKFLIKKPLYKVKELMDSQKFQQVHRKYLINLDKVVKIDTYTNLVYLECGVTVSISDRYKKTFIKSYPIIK